MCGLPKTHKSSLSETDTTPPLPLETAKALRSHGEDASEGSKSEALFRGAGVIWQMGLSRGALRSAVKSKRLPAKMHLARDQFGESTALSVVGEFLNGARQTPMRSAQMPAREFARHSRR